MEESECVFIWNVEVFPRRPASEESLRALGEGLKCWWKHEEARIQDIDREGIEDLLTGELPRPHGLYTKPRSYVGKIDDWEFDIGDMAELVETHTPQEILDKMWERISPRRSVCVVMRGGKDGQQWKRETAKSLREFISPDWVEDVRLHGESWRAVLGDG